MLATKKCLGIERLRNAIDAWLSNNDMRAVRWYTAKEWEAKGEEMCEGASLHAVMEESELSGLLGYCHDQELWNDFNDLVTVHGYWFELGFSWSVHFYEVDCEDSFNG
jgi:hypothetical protein